MDIQPINLEVKEALQKRDIEDLVKEMHQGFEGMHLRQDTTNGKVLKNTGDISSLQIWVEKQAIKEKYNRLIWYCLTISISAIGVLLTYILTRPH